MDMLNRLLFEQASTMLNMDFAAQIAIDADALEWLPSPMLGVERKPLAREDAERGHATSIVRYAPGSVFRAHPHPLGEEILVLDGVFCDETGEYPAGTYFRNPPGSSHAPFSPNGCTLFVKLHQFAPLDSEQVVVPSDVIETLPVQQPFLLHEHETEQVFLLRLNQEDALASSFERFSGAFEMLVISGCVNYEDNELNSLNWLRTPDFHANSIKAKEESILWLKFGHF